MAATYNFPDVTSGDTFAGRNVATITQGSTAISITRAKMEFRNASGLLVKKWDSSGANPQATITGGDNNIVTIEPADTSSWSIGTLYYDLEVWIESTGQKLTILKGTITVERGVTSN